MVENMSEAEQQTNEISKKILKQNRTIIKSIIKQNLTRVNNNLIDFLGICGQQKSNKHLSEKGLDLTPLYKKGEIKTSLIMKNKAYLDISYDENDNVSKCYLKPEIFSRIRKEILTFLNNDSSGFKDADEEDTWYGRRLDGGELEIKNTLNYNKFRRHIADYPDDDEFVYKWNGVKPDFLKNTDVLQVINVNITSKGEITQIPIEFHYLCPECGAESQRKEYEVASSNNKICCPNEIIIEQGDGKPDKIKRCNTTLYPDMKISNYKTVYTYTASYKDIDNITNAEITRNVNVVCLKELPVGKTIIAGLNVPALNGETTFFAIDYKPFETVDVEIPEPSEDKHRIFKIIDTVDNHIKNTTNHYHHGFLPMKIAMLAQLAARKNKHMENNFNIALVGGKGSGKTTFSEYWGTALYGINFSSLMETSVPFLRGGIIEKNLFGRKVQQKTRGLLGSVDLILIDELKEDKVLKKNLKPFLLSPKYKYSKHGGDDVALTRTAQMIVTENINPEHYDKYVENVRFFYQYSDSIKTPDGDDEFEEVDLRNIDLTLPLYKYDNPHVKSAVKKARDDYATRNINWIDGSENALADRFFFYFFIGGEKNNDEFLKTIRENSMKPNKGMSDNKHLLSINNIGDDIISNDVKYEGDNEYEYLEKVDKALIEYDYELTDGRVSGMFHNLIKIVRMIDKRDYYKPIDLKIVKYMIETIRSKVTISDTKDFKLSNE